MTLKYVQAYRITNDLEEQGAHDESLVRADITSLIREPDTIVCCLSTTEVTQVIAAGNGLSGSRQLQIDLELPVSGTFNIIGALVHRNGSTRVYADKQTRIETIDEPEPVYLDAQRPRDESDRQERLIFERDLRRERIRIPG